MRYFKIVVLFTTVVLCMFTACEDNPQEADDGEFEGRTEWNARSFSQLPESAPFDLTLQLQKDSLNGQKVLHMDVLLQNSNSDSVFIYTRASDGPLFNFTVTTSDNIRIWSRLQSNVAGAAKAEITLKPGETQQYEHSWNFKNYKGETIAGGKYLVYGTFPPLTVTDSSFTNKVKEYDSPVVGPDTIEVNLQQ